MCVKEKQVHLECAVHFIVSLSFLGMNLKTFKSKWIWIVNCYELQTCLFNLNNTLFKILIFRQSGYLKVSKCKDCTCIHVNLKTDPLQILNIALKIILTVVNFMKLQKIWAFRNLFQNCQIT